MLADAMAFGLVVLTDFCWDKRLAAQWGSLKEHRWAVSSAASSGSCSDRTRVAATAVCWADTSEPWTDAPSADRTAARRAAKWAGSTDAMTVASLAST